METHAIWSSGVPKLARISDNATFTIEMSTSAISAAHIAATVIQSFEPVMGVSIVPSGRPTLSVRPRS